MTSSIRSRVSANHRTIYSCSFPVILIVPDRNGDTRGETGPVASLTFTVYRTITN